MGGVEGQYRFVRSLDRRRIQLLAMTIVGGSALVAALLLATGGMGPDGGPLGIRLTTAQTEDPATGGGGGSTGGGSRASSDEAPRGDSVEAFVRAHGDPPGTDFARLRIPVLGVNAPVGLHLVVDGQMPEPLGPVDVAFYDLSDWPGLGGFPGEGGNAIFGGHVDLNRTIAYADAHYRGPAVFWGLDRLRRGDIIEVDYLGETLRYAVTDVQELDAERTDWGAIWSNDVEVDTITLFTCGGEFDREAHSYSHRVVVTAQRIS